LYLKDQTITVEPLRYTICEMGKKLSKTENVRFMGLMKTENWKRQSSEDMFNPLRNQVNFQVFKSDKSL
jgi:hypothetical protein